jgi:hypothetical protein
VVQHLEAPSIAAKPDEVRNLLLDRLDPEPCFKKLRGVAALRLIALVPVGLLLGLGSCALHAPATSAPESVAKESTQPETAAPASAPRLQNCSAGSADCDGNAANACEVVLANDPKNCGACGVTCAAQNGEGSCLGGTCRMVFCIPGHCDLDGDPKNGCEARTKGCRVNKE